MVLVSNPGALRVFWASSGQITEKHVQEWDLCLEERKCAFSFRRQCARGWSSWWRRGRIIQETTPETRGESFMHFTSIYQASTVCFSHLSCLYPGLFPTQPGRLWVCFHETASPLHHRLGPGHLLGRPVWEPAYSALAGSSSGSQLSRGKEVLARVLCAIWSWAFGPLSRGVN